MCTEKELATQHPAEMPAEYYIFREYDAGY